MALFMAGIQRQAGHRVLIAYSPRPGAPADLRARVHPGVQLERLRMRPLLPHLALWCWRYARLLRRWNPDLLHFHGARAGFMGRVVAGRRFGRRALYSPHCISLMHLDRSRLERSVYRSLERMANRICGALYVACSEQERAVIAREIKADAALLENAVEDGLLAAVRGGGAQGGGPKRVVNCSRISASKDPSLFAEVCKAVQAERPEIEFRWIGDGDPRRRKELERAGVRVTGWVSRADALREVAGGWVYLSTSSWEGLPVSLIEAMFLKVPVLCRNAPWSAPLLRGGETGRLFDDAPSAASALLEEDHAWRKTVAEAAWAAASERYSQARFSADLARICEQVRAKE